MQGDQSKLSSIDALFKPIREFRDMSISTFLKKILECKGVTVVELHQILLQSKYVIELESLYRYFNPSEQSNRFPPKNFIKAFSVSMGLTDDQADLLIIFWSNAKLGKKIQRKIKKKFYSDLD